MDLATPECLRLITEAMVPGMASAIIREGRLDRYVCCWARDAQAAAQVDDPGFARAVNGVGSAQRADKLPPRALAMLTRLKVHTHFGNPCRDIETGRAFDADWLQGNRVSRPADQYVGADTDTDRRTCRHSTIRSGERSRCEIHGRCNHRPDHHATL